jgi:excisionase family DNA binding protein
MIMHTAVSPLATVTAPESERPTLQRLDRLLSGAGADSLVLTAADGLREQVPASMLRLLSAAAHQLAHGSSITLLAASQALTTKQAAALLGVSRPYLVRLLDRGDLPFYRVGNHRRIRLDDLLTYRAERQQQQERTLDELTALSDEYGLYDAGVSAAHS